MTQLLPYAQLRMMFQISLPPPASPGLRSNPEPYSGTPLPTSSIPDQSRGWETRVWAPNTLTGSGRRCDKGIKERRNERYHSLKVVPGIFNPCQQGREILISSSGSQSTQTRKPRVPLHPNPDFPVRSDRNTRFRSFPLPSSHYSGPANAYTCPTSTASSGSNNNARQSESNSIHPRRL